MPERFPTIQSSRRDGKGKMEKGKFGRPLLAESVIRWFDPGTQEALGYT
jgi:hypothetical protein